MPRCLMAKKWKTYPWAMRDTDEGIMCGEGTTDGDKHLEDEEIDVVGDGSWAVGPASPTAGATAPSPSPSMPPNLGPTPAAASTAIVAATDCPGASRVAVLYNDWPLREE
ncbi:hypothetical protein R5R35_003206 [Gryllus longicercus]|uniref:Uncharacterized protein n=1 Tax=Gryllus longicercus TaxID=2509291 RepID=A0AAN9VY54_9ORTH